METVYQESECMKRMNSGILSDINSTLATCVELDICCAQVEELWGIWFEFQGVSYLVDPLELINSIYVEDRFWLMKNVTSDQTIVVDVRKDSHCYTWRFCEGVIGDGYPIHFSFDEYVGKIHQSLQLLYNAWCEEKPMAYGNDNDFDKETIAFGLEQLNVKATLPRYTRLWSSMLQKESFCFEPQEDEYKEKIKIGIGSRTYSTWLTHWDSNYECIRHQLETFVYERNAVIRLPYDMSETVVRLEKVNILDQVNEIHNGYGFKYKDFVSVEILPNEFAHKPVVKGFCNVKQTIQTFYEGLLRLALSHEIEEPYDEEPLLLDAYNMFKSPIVERYLLGEQLDDQHASVRQVWVRRILKICPDYDFLISDLCGEPLDIEGNNELIDGLRDKDGNQLSIKGLQEWGNEIKNIIVKSETGRDYSSFDWKDFHRRGLDLAQQLKEKLPSDIDLWYEAPFEDNSRTILHPMLIYDKSL